jgi:hypothetical protein
MPYIILCQETEEAAPKVCEFDGGVCYDHYVTLDQAQAACDSYNARSHANGWTSTYRPTIAPVDMILG